MRKLLMLALAVIVGLCYSLPVSAQQQQGDKKFEVSGEVRFRGDAVNNPTDFADNPDGTDDTGLSWPWRVRAGIHGSFARNVSAHAEFQAWGVAGDGTSGLFPVFGASNTDVDTFSGDDSSNVQLYQGYLELGDIGGTTFDLRLGRQELVFGNEMLLGDNDFYNGTVHDGARAGWQYKKWSLDTWYVKTEDGIVGSTSTTPFTDVNSSDDNTFFGAYAVFKATKKIGFDAYFLAKNDNSAAIDEERTTYGGRVYSKWDSNWSWWAELALQTGEFDDGVTTADISASGFEGELAYTFKKAKVRPRVHGRYSMFTGEDDDATDSESFDAMFQDTHGRYGLFDLFAPVNLNVLEVGVSWNGKEDRHVFGANYLMFTSNEETVGGVDVGEDDLGSELDLYYNFAYSRNVMIQAAIAQFSPGDLFGDGVSDTADSMPGVDTLIPGRDDSAMRVYGNVRLRF